MVWRVGVGEVGRTVGCERCCVARECPVGVLREAGLKPVQSGGAAGLEALGEREVGAVVSTAGNAEVCEHDHVRAT